MPETTTKQRKLVIHCQDHFNEALAFSMQNISEGHHTLEANVRQLLAGGYDGDELHLYKDFAPHSFTFSFHTPDSTATNGFRLGLSGGIILHGLGETFSVELQAPSTLHYSIHT